MKSLYILGLGVLGMTLGLGGCAKKSTEPAPDYTAKITGKILRAEDSASISSANVLLYDANTNVSVNRMSSDGTGDFSFEVPAGDYYLVVAAQGRISFPPTGGKPLPFHADSSRSYVRNVYLDKDTSVTNTGGISGKVVVSGSTHVDGILIIARRTDSAAFSTTTGPDGFFALYNVPPGTYQLKGYRDSLTQDTTTVQVTVKPDTLTTNVVINMSPSIGKTLLGKVTFLASPNSTVDITLVDPLTREAIPGLNVRNDSANTFTMRGIPAGDYIAWASYRNDGYVMDPDAIRKFGLPRVSFAAGDTAKTVNFSVTGAITLVGPTNAADTLYPVAVHTLTPVFSWLKYPSAKEYIVEVFDAKGKRIWGGFNSSGVILHPAILAAADSVRFNFDGSALSPLKAGGIYSWRVYADNDAQANVQGLISSSEDLRGLFQVVLP